mmetsp:Transcript_90169/g.165477  ORF Transcript_90169/g.165477 Transcript_90169/m.165477 type:complete len:449 (-) Transcript_90169:86-1432(-)
MFGVIEMVEKAVSVVVACGVVKGMIATTRSFFEQNASEENVRSVLFVVLTLIGGLCLCFKRYREQHTEHQKAVYRAEYRAQYNQLTVSLNMLEPDAAGHDEFYIRTVKVVPLTMVFCDEDHWARFKELLDQTTEDDPFLPFNQCPTQECQNWVNNVVALDQEVKKDLLNLMSQESSSSFFEGVCEEQEYCFAVTMEKHEQGSKIAEKPRVYLQKKTSLKHLFEDYVQTGAKPNFPETEDKMEKRWNFTKMWAERVFGNNPDAGLEDSNIKLAVPAMHRTFKQLCDVCSKQNEIYDELGDARNKQTKIGDELDDVRKEQTEIRSQLDDMRNKQMEAQNILQSVHSMLQKINVQRGDVDALNTGFDAMKTELLESRADVRSLQTELGKMHAEVLACRSKLQVGAETQDAVQKTPKKPQPNSTASTATPSSALRTASPSRSLSELISPQDS